MPVYVDDFKFGWSALEGALNDLGDANNSNAPLEGAGIRIEETKAGCIISRADMVPGANKEQPSGGTFGWVPVVIRGCRWVQVTVVDPGTCGQTDIVVLQNTAEDTDYAPVVAWIDSTNPDTKNPPPASAIPDY